MPKDYTASQVSSWFGVNPVTLRKWLNSGEYPLKIDGDSADGSRWRRFTLTDIVRFQLIDFLVRRGRIDTPASIKLTNELFETLSNWTDFVLQESEILGGYAGVEACWILVTDLSADAPKISKPQGIHDLAKMLDAQVDGAVVINLTEMVRRATLSTERVWIEPSSVAPSNTNEDSEQ